MEMHFWLPRAEAALAEVVGDRGRVGTGDFTLADSATLLIL